MADPVERQLLRDVLAWGRANGWRRQPQIRTEWCWSRNIDADTARGNTVSYSTATGSPNLVIWGYGQPETLGIQHACDLLAAYGILPARFSSAYAAGRADAVEDQIDLSVEVRLDSILEGVTEEQIEAAIGERLNNLYSADDPFEARRQRGEVVEAMYEAMAAVWREQPCAPQYIGPWLVPQVAPGVIGHG